MRTCTVGGCDKKHYAKGFCQYHYGRVLKGLELNAKVYKCKVEGCEREHAALDYCEKHYKQFKTWGYIKKYDWDHSSNQIIIYNNHAEVVVIKSDGMSKKYVLIDIDDVDKISKYKWCIDGNGYAFRSSVGKMHRYILGAIDKKQIIDHANGNKLDNRKCNLRYCSTSQNIQNSKKQSNNTSGFKGVSWHKRDDRWVASIKVGDRLVHLGYFVDILDAAKAYNDAAIKNFGEFANLNVLE